MLLVGHENVLKRKNINFRLTSVAEKRLRLSFYYSRYEN